MILLMLIALVIGLATGFWAGVLILSSLVLAGSAFKLADRSEDDVRSGP